MPTTPSNPSNLAPVRPAKGTLAPGAPDVRGAGQFSNFVSDSKRIRGQRSSVAPRTTVSPMITGSGIEYPKH